MPAVNVPCLSHPDSAIIVSEITATALLSHGVLLCTACACLLVIIVIWSEVEWLTDLGLRWPWPKTDRFDFLHPDLVAGRG